MRRPSLRFRQRTVAVVVGILVLGLGLPDAERFDLAVGQAADARLAALDWIQAPHRVRVVDRADDAFATRIAMIRDARERIDMSSFIWRDDASGHQVFGELVAAARRGVRVRLLGDALFFLRDSARVASMAGAHPNLELRLYNPVDGRLKALDLGFLDDLAIDFKGVNRRMHLKLLIVDGERVLLGGRNIGDEYFGRHDQINFVDRDVVVEGPAVAEAETCFQAFWSDHASEDPFDFEDVRPADATSSWDHPPAQLARDAIGDAWFEPVRIGLWWDRPHADGLTRFYNPDVLANRMAVLFGTARERILIQSPYLILSERTRQLFTRLRDHHDDLELTCITNSLAATDDWKAYAGMFAQLRELLGQHHFRIHAHRPEACTDLAGTSRGQSSIHAKTYVVDDRFAAVGTYNFDPRSGYWNAEVMLVVDDEAFAEAMAERVIHHTAPAASWVIAERRRPPVVAQAEETWAFLCRVTADILRLDLWPLIDHDYYEHVAGEPVPPDHPSFHQRYRSLGPFPDVPFSTDRRIKLQLLGGLGEAASPAL